MNEVLDHRGPDGTGYAYLGTTARFSTTPSLAPVAGDRVALGHKRLSIIDLSPAGTQPMASNDGTLWITYNGEIYNYIELRDELSRLGHTFRSATDTEVIIAAYSEWGTGCFARFNGMWALAIWDRRTRSLLLSRDRFGVKPLYYVRLDDGGIGFASEIKALLAGKLVASKLDVGTCVDFLKWSLADHYDRTFFTGVTALTSGHFLVLNDDTEMPRPMPYWRLTPSDDVETDRDEGRKRFRELFGDAVELRMRSDVPVGSCLSGGLDSSSIVCLAASGAGRRPGSLHTFTAGSADPAVDERAWSRLAGAHAGVREHEVVPTAAGFVEDLDDLLWHQEQPFSTSSIYAQWCIMREAHASGIPVLLDGQGADEVLCGYRKYYFFYLRELLRLGRYLAAAREASALLRHGDRGIFNMRDAARYLPGALRRALPDLGDYITPAWHDHWHTSQARLGAGSSVRDRQLGDVYRYSVPALLRYEDRNSMAWSIESRVPFLDYRLVEWLVNCPSGIKLARGLTKAVMRDAMRGVVPDAILDRRDKVGFTTSQTDWMRGDLRQPIEEALAAPSDPLHEMLDMPRLRREFAAWLENRSRLDHGHFFRVFIVDRWLKKFILND
jgi:asparagine synthase (glutamine-hydrolysing)